MSGIEKRTRSMGNYTNPKQVSGKNDPATITGRPPNSGSTFKTDAERIAVARKVCQRYARGLYTLPDCCRRYDIHVGTFRRWARPDADINRMILDGVDFPTGFIMEVRELYEEAKNLNKHSFKDDLRDEARVALRRRVQGYEAEETTTEQKIDTERTIWDDANETHIPNPNYGQLLPVSIKRKVFHVAPDTTAVIYALNNVDSDNFRQKNQIEHTGSVGINDDLESLSPMELEKKELELLQRMEARKNRK
jgi:hypothetical protein